MLKRDNYADRVDVAQLVCGTKTSKACHIREREMATRTVASSCGNFWRRKRSEHIIRRVAHAVKLECPPTVRLGEHTFNADVCTLAERFKFIITEIPQREHRTCL